MMTTTTAKKKSLGRQKIPMKKIEKESSLQVSFSKRKSSLFKKASELSILCGVNISVIVFSPGGKAFSFGHPSVESVVNRYIDSTITTNHGGNGGGYSSTSSSHSDHLTDYSDNREYMNLATMLEEERRKKEEIQKNGLNGWMDLVDMNIEDMGLQELQELKMKLEDLKCNVSAESAAAPPPLPILESSENPVPSDEMNFQTGPFENNLEEWFSGLPMPLPDYFF